MTLTRGLASRLVIHTFEVGGTHGFVEMNTRTRRLRRWTYR